jgi:hypothetical protein
LTVTTSSATLTVTPAGTVMGLRPIRDIREPPRFGCVPYHT